MKILLALALLSSAASAQTVALRPIDAPLAVSAAPFAARTATPGLPAAAVFAAPALSAPSAALASMPVAELAAVPASAAAAPAASTLEKEPNAAPAAAALSEFSRIVSQLMNGDSSRSRTAAAELLKIRDAHLNDDPEPRKIGVLKLKPMQIPAGMREVQEKAALLSGMRSKDAEKWLYDKSVPYVEDYEGRKRPVDHHHEARAAWEADYDEVYVHRYFDDKLHRLIRALPRDEFYAVTRAMGLFYDRDQFGAGPHDPNHLPEDVRGLADDPYRGLAGIVRKLGGFDKTLVPFAEFKWARFFRERLKTYPAGDDFDKAVAEAMRIVHDPAARGLPGYKPK